MEVWFVRHGQSESNAGLRSDWPDGVRLTDTGRAQADLIAAAMPHAPDMFVMSPYIRTQETATPTLVRFPLVPRVIWPVQEFTYLPPKTYRNTTMAERLPAVQAYWEQADPDAVVGPGAESFRAFGARLVGCLERLRSANVSWTVMFSHGMVIRGLLWLTLTQPKQFNGDQMRRYHHFLAAVKMPNGAIWRLSWPGESEAARFESFRTDHLSERLITN